MILFVVALKDEAKPLVEFFKLQHQPAIKEFKVYQRDELVLIISGVGKIKSAVATTYIINKFQDIQAVINFGICGCGDLHINTGEILLANKIVDETTGKNYFSDISFKHTFREFPIHTFDKPVMGAAIRPIGVDMEASGFFEGCLKFVPASKIFSVKIVSDHLDKNEIDPLFVVELIRKHVKEIESFVSSFRTKEEKKSLSTLDKINLSSRIT